MKTRVRFHLGRGEHYQKWQVSRGGEVTFYDPSTVCLKMKGCQLKNHRKVAEQIYSGENKTVCAWINCEQVEVAPPQKNAVKGPAALLTYNPKVRPHWSSASAPSVENLDGAEFGEITSHGRALVAVRRKAAA